MENQYQNAIALYKLKELGYPLMNIRKAFHKLTGIGQPELAKMLGESRQNITLHIGGIRTKRAIQEGIAEIYHVPVEEFFDGAQKNNTH